MTRIFGFAGWERRGENDSHPAGHRPPRSSGAARRHPQTCPPTTSTSTTPGKDSWEHRKAGAAEVLVVSDTRWALMHELNGAAEPSLPELLAKLAPADIVLIEGFKRSAIPKIEVFRAANGKAPLHPGDDSIIAIAADIAFPEAGRPVLPLDDIAAIADFIRAHARALWTQPPSSSPAAAAAAWGAPSRRCCRSAGARCSTTCCSASKGRCPRSPSAPMTPAISAPWPLLADQS